MIVCLSCLIAQQAPRSNLKSRFFAISHDYKPPFRLRIGYVSYLTQVAFCLYLEMVTTKYQVNQKLIANLNYHKDILPM